MNPIWVIEERCNFGWVAIDFRHTRKEARKIKADLSRARESVTGATQLKNEFRVFKYSRETKS